jgi:beta-mannanase
MKKTLITTLIITLTIQSISFAIGERIPPLQYGIYSNNKSHYSLKNLTIHHYFTTWHTNENKVNKDYIQRFNQAAKDNPDFQMGILTIEPWPMFGEGNNRDLLLNNILKGKYDKQILNLCNIINQFSQTNIILRWGHEMDLYASSRYPWASSNSGLYVKAYKKWVDTCKQYTSKAKFQWSPAIIIGHENYYPGDQYVDYIGMSWYSYPAFEWYTYKKILSFDNIMNWKYNSAKVYNKPIIATEFGMAETNKTDVLNKLLDKKNLIKKYPLLQGIILFSDHTESWIPNVIATPDWRLDSEYLSRLR